MKQANDKIEDETAVSVAPPPRLHHEKYKDHLEGMELSDDQARELLETLWHVMVSFVDVGFRVDSLSIAMPDIYQGESLSGHTGAITHKENTTGETP